MRIGNNPQKDLVLSNPEYLHQIIIPIYIPNQEEYFKESLEILKVCLNSIFKTTHNKTFISIVNNGSCLEVKNYLEELFLNVKIHELIHTENIGKLNAVIKGLVGNNIELVTITDADVLFISGWQEETNKIFDKIPKAGVVGLTPQFKTYSSYCSNFIFDNLFSRKLRFIPVLDSEAIISFYDSIGWEKNYNQNYLQYNLAYQLDDLNVLVGSGHYVATYKKDMFEEITSFLGYKLGGDSETYLDKIQFKKDYWRLTTQQNFAFHMGNTLEKWVCEIKFQNLKAITYQSGYHKNNKINPVIYFIKIKLFQKLFSNKNFQMWFLKSKGLPKEMIKNY
jgi:hypothetical protein